MFRLPRWLTSEFLTKAGRVLRAAARDFLADNGPNWAASIAYYSLLSLFPLLLVVTSVAAIFVERSWAVQQATLYLGDLLPRGSAAIEKVVTQTISAGRGPGLLSLLPLFWTASLVFNAITRALNVAFHAREDGRFWRRLVVRFTMLLALGGMFVAALVSSAALRLVHFSLGYLPRGQEFIFDLIVNTTPAVFMLVAFFLAYRFIPTRQPDWRPALFGAGVAALLFAAAKPLFLGYLKNLARYDVVYGSLTGIIVVVFWIWMASMIGLYGGEVAAHAQAVFIDHEHLESKHRTDSSG